MKKKGVLDWSYTGLVYSKDGTAYIVNGILDKDYTGVVEDSAGVLWYVENGMVNKEYNGYVKSDDVTYKVINGIAVKHNHLYTSEVTKRQHVLRMVKRHIHAQYVMILTQNL